MEGPQHGHPEGELTVHQIFHQLKAEKQRKLTHLMKHNPNALISDRDLSDQAHLMKTNLNPRAKELTSNIMKRSESYLSRPMHSAIKSKMSTTQNIGDIDLAYPATTSMGSTTSIDLISSNI